MNEYIDMIGKSLELTNTLDEAMTYMDGKLSQNKWNETFSMMNDFIIGINKIDESVRMMMKELPVNCLEELMDELLENLGKISHTYETADDNAIRAVFSKMREAFDKMHLELIRVLQPYTIS